MVVSADQPPDGDWRAILNEAQRRQAPPPVLVASPVPDERLWAEVLNLGGQDVLTIPFAQKEVFLSISAAWRHWRERLLADSSTDAPDFRRRRTA